MLYPGSVIVMYLAPRRSIHHQPGAPPQVLSHPERASAESAIHLRYNPMHPPIEARFQRLFTRQFEFLTVGQTLIIP
jgi:hypothetical protein